MYDEGKRAAEALAVAWFRQYGTDVRIARIHNTYGPGMDRDDGRMIPNFIARALAGERLEIYGDGEQTRSLCYVDDMVEGLMRLMNSPRTCPATGAPSRPVNLGNPDERTVNEIAAAVLAACIRDPTNRRHLPALEDDPRQRCPDISRAKGLLGWEPKTSLGEGLERTIGWFRKRAAEEEADRSYDSLPAALAGDD